MKQFLILSFLTFFGLSSLQAKSITDFTDLSDLMVELSDVASEGASLAYFGYSERFFHKDLGECKIVSAKKAVEMSMDIFSSIIDYRDLSDQKTSLQALFGHGLLDLKTKHHLKFHLFKWAPETTQ